MTRQQLVSIGVPVLNEELNFPILISRVIPDIMLAVMMGQERIVRNLDAKRPRQHVIDLCTGYLQYLDKALQNLVEPPALNFGPNEVGYSVKEVIKRAKSHFNEQLSINYIESSRYELESEQLHLDSSRAFREIHWNPKWSQDEALDRTFAWWKRVLSKPTEIKEACLEDLNRHSSTNLKKGFSHER
jgi:CDP-glucose 4,6-dehydratase